MNIVKKVLENESKQLQKYKTIEVAKHLDVRIDLGMMMCSDPNELNENSLKIDSDEYILQLTRDNLQLLVNEIWQLPTARVEECIVAKLPVPSFILPRTRKCPVQKPLTKWEKFAKEKNIKKTKKDKKIFDQELGKWVPTYGYKRTQAEKDREWVLEVPQNVDPMEDQFKKKMNLRIEKVAKNEIKRMQNIVRAKKEIAPRAGYFGPETASAKEFLAAASIAKASTASIGKFQKQIPKEKIARGLGVKELIPGAKRKASHISDVSENVQNLELINSVLNKRPKIDMDKAISLQKKEAQAERERIPVQRKTCKNKRTQRITRKNNKKSTRPSGISNRKPKAGAGERKKFAGGRKRR